MVLLRTNRISLIRVLAESVLDIWIRGSGRKVRHGGSFGTITSKLMLKKCVHEIKKSITSKRRLERIIHRNELVYRPVGRL